MIYSCSIEMNVPIKKAVALFNDPRHFSDWQDGFVSYEHLSGIPRQQGARSKVVFVNGRRRIEMIETIQAMNLPQEMTALYEHKHMVNTMVTQFTALPGDKTRFTTGVGCTRFIGFIPKLMSLLFSGMYKKQSQKWLDRFKKFAEKEYAGR